MTKPQQSPRQPSKTLWRGLCGRCGVTVEGGQSKRHALYGLVCRLGCKAS